VIARLAVLGLGLLGGSVVKAARAAGLAREIVGIGRDRARLEPARRDGVVDHVTTDIAAGVRGADVVVLAATVDAIERQLETVAGAVGPDTLVTDVGSTKAAIVAAADRLARTRPFAFVGSHPMAGSEQSGYAVSRADLFRGATVIVTPTDRTPPALVKSTSAFWEALGAGRIVSLDPPTHDRAVAAISHLPHVVAFALVDAVARFEPAAFEVAARGFKDTTRIAASDPEVWRTILFANRTAVVDSLAVFREALAALERLIADDDAAALDAAIARVKARREALR
jgi:prephenate dehydrogenase